MSTAKHTIASVAEDPQRVRELSITELYHMSFRAQAVATACVVELASREHLENNGEEIRGKRYSDDWFDEWTRKRMRGV